MGVDLEILSVGIVRRSPSVRNTVKGLSFKSAGARSLGVEGRARHGRARLDERLGSWNERRGSIMSWSSFE